MKWSFQLLLEVFLHSSELNLSNIRFPIITELETRDDHAIFNYPFTFSYIMDTDTHDSTVVPREYAQGKFIKSGDNIKFHSDVLETEPFEPVFIEAVISRDRLIKT